MSSEMWFLSRAVDCMCTCWGVGSEQHVDTQCSGCWDTGVKNKVGKGQAMEGLVVQAGKLDCIQETLLS